MNDEGNRLGQVVREIVKKSRELEELKKELEKIGKQFVLAGKKLIDNPTCLGFGRYTDVDGLRKDTLTIDERYLKAFNVEFLGAKISQMKKLQEKLEKLKEEQKLLSGKNEAEREKRMWNDSDAWN